MTIKLETSTAAATPIIAAPAKTVAPVRELTAPVIGALLAVYLIWGSTYLGMAVAVETIPPFMMSAGRFACAGLILVAAMRLRGAPMPSRAQMRNALLTGGLMIGGGTGAVAFAGQWVDSGLAALAVAVVPLWAALFGGLWGRWPTRGEWGGILIGLAGIALLNLDDGMRAHPLGALVLVGGPMCWAFGSMLSRQIAMPSGLMSAAFQMLGGMIVLVGLSLATGESLTALPSGRSALAFIYLTSVGSLIGFTAYIYLLRTVRPALATSYAYVNPIVAVLLGVTLADERISPLGVVAMLIILSGVALIVLKPGVKARA